MSIDYATVSVIFSTLVESAAQIGLATLVVAQAGPRRGHYLLRLAGAAATLVAFCAASAIVSTAVGASMLLSQAVTYLLMLGALTAAALLCHAVTSLTALCFATAGHAAQTLSMSVYELIRVLGSVLATGPVPDWVETLLFWLPYGLVVAALYLAFARRARSRGFAEMGDASMLMVAAVAVMVIIVYDLTVRGLSDGAATAQTLAVLRAVQALMCSFIIYTEYELLYKRRLRTEAEAAERALADSERRYDRSREAVDAVNLRCHYIRRQIRGLRELEEGDAAGTDAGAGGAGDAGAGGVDLAELDALEAQVDAYDAAVRTGNEALDVIVSEKRLECAREGIELTCIADGRALAALSPADLYAIVGGALDGAIDASRGVAAGERTVSLTLRAARGMAVLHVENRCAGEVRLVDGLPVPPAGPAVGGGAASGGATAGAGGEPPGALAARSMRLATERLGGGVSFSAERDILIVDVLLPMA